jgi:preprotein translocase subunit SecD
MRCSGCLLIALFFIGSSGPSPGQDKTPKVPKSPPDGVYAVLRASVKEKDVLPLKAAEVLVVHDYKFLKKDEKGQSLFLVVRTAPDVKLSLVGKPKVVQDGKEAVAIFLKLQPDAAKALEQLTTAHLDKEVAIIVGGEVVTTHKVREAIKGGDVQITSCTARALNYLLEKLTPPQKD